MLRVKSNETYHGTFVTFTAEFDVILEKCQKVNPAEFHTRSSSFVAPSKSGQLHSQYFEREAIVEMIACDVEQNYGEFTFMYILTIMFTIACKNK